MNRKSHKKWGKKLPKKMAQNKKIHFLSFLGGEQRNRKSPLSQSEVRCVMGRFLSSGGGGDEFRTFFCIIALFLHIFP